MTQNFLVLRDIGLRIEQIYSLEFIHYQEFNGAQSNMNQNDCMQCLDSQTFFLEDIIHCKLFDTLQAEKMKALPEDANFQEALFFWEYFDEEYNPSFDTIITILFSFNLNLSLVNMMCLNFERRLESTSKKNIVALAKVISEENIQLLFFVIKRTLKFLGAPKANDSVEYEKNLLTKNCQKRLLGYDTDKDITLEALEGEFKGIKNSKESILYLLRLCHNVLCLYYEIGKKFQNVAILLYHFLSYAAEVEKSILLPLKTLR